MRCNLDFFNSPGPFMIRRMNRGIVINSKNKIEIDFSVQDIIFEQLFSYKWHPSGLDLKTNYFKEEKTLVEFTLKKLAHTVLFTVRESGFEHLLEFHRVESYSASEK